MFGYNDTSINKAEAKFKEFDAIVMDGGSPDLQQRATAGKAFWRNLRLK